MDNVSSPTYPQNVVNAEPVSRATADAAITAASNALGRAAATLEGDARWPIMRDAPVDYRDLLDGLVRDVGMAKANPRLTPEAKMADARRVAAAWRPRAEEVVTDLEVRVRDWQADIERRTRPNAPIADRGHLEAALANARADARMVLDASEDAELPDRLAELARDDELLRYLVLGTNWPSTYFRGRDAKSAPMLWPPVRRRLLAEFLDAGGVTALERMDGIEHARKAAIALRAGHELMIANNRAYFPQAEGR
jgi:hypothetical protein